MGAYKELRIGGTNQSLGYVKVIKNSDIDMNLTLVTTNGNNYFTLGSVGGILFPITISVEVLTRSGFTQVNSNYNIDLAQTESVYRVSYTNGSFVEVLYDGQNFFYLTPDTFNIEGCCRIQVDTIEQLQTEVYVHERGDLILSILSTEINKTNLEERLLMLLSPNYQSIEGPNHGCLVDNDPARPDYEYIRMEPLDRNTNPADITIGAFNGNLCTITIHILNMAFHYQYGEDYRLVQNKFPHLHNVFVQYANYLRCLYDTVNDAIRYSLTC